MADNVADRLAWAVKLMAVEASDKVLEIGCGQGAAVSLVCRCLVDGTVVGIDRSEKMIRAAEKRNASYIAEGKARFWTASLHEADLGASQFDKIFAVNVNLFWMDAARELDKIRGHLAPGGSIYLINQPPDAGKIPLIAERTAANLSRAGFVVRRIAEDRSPASAVCVTAGRDDS